MGKSKGLNMKIEALKNIPSGRFRNGLIKKKKCIKQFLLISGFCESPQLFKSINNNFNLKEILRTFSVPW